MSEEPADGRERDGTGRSAADRPADASRRALLRSVGQAGVAATALLAGCSSPLGSSNGQLGPESSTGGSTSTGSATPSTLDQFGVGVYLGNEAALGPWERWFGRTVDYYSFNVPSERWEQYRIENMPLERPIEEIARDRAIVVTLHMYPSAQTTMRAVVDGEHDEQYRAIARNYVRNGLSDATLRISHEMNGRWAATGAVGRPDLFVEAWRHVVDVLDSVEETAFDYVWAPHLGRFHMDPTDAYPGDDWVDQVGLTVYDKSELYYPEGCDRECVRDRRRQVWRTFVEKEFGLNFWAEFARDHDKRLVFPEYGVVDENRNGVGGGDNPRFFRRFSEWMLDNRDTVGWHNVWAFVAGPHFVGPASVFQSTEFSRHADASEEFRSLYGGQ